MKVTTRARVRVTLEIDMPDSWGADCSLAQVFRQGEQGAIDLLRRHFSLGDGVKIAGFEQDATARVLGKPTVLAVTSSGENDHE
jgi:hypothetical protein